METNKRFTQLEFYKALQQFTGTKNYYLHIFNQQYLFLTDGAQFIRKEAKASWLFDRILCLQKYRKISKLSFQIWRIRKESKRQWILGCLDKDANVLYGKRIGNIDFPVDELELWIIDRVALLPLEL